MRSSQSEPLVSIITPSFNQARFLEATIRSVLSQDYPRIEYIVIDGGSRDGSLEIIQKYADRLAYWTSEPDRGQSHAINKGLRRATGEIVAWLNSDDLYLPGAVREAVEALARHPEAAMVYGDGLLVDEEGRLLDRHHYRTYSALDLLCFEVLLQPTAFIRREAVEAVGYLDEGYHLVLDHDLWVRLAARWPLVHVPRYWAAERTYGQAKTMAAAADFLEEARRLVARAAESPELAPIIDANRPRVEASLEAFGARRMIDAGRYGEALRLFGRALLRRPAVVLRYWYKVLQALIGTLGLEATFLWYRQARRRLQHRGARLVLAERGAELVGGRR